MTIGQSVLDNVVSFKDLVTGAALVSGVKYTFEQVTSKDLESRKTNDRAPMRFIYRNVNTSALIKISSFDLGSFLFDDKSFQDYFKSYPTQYVDTSIAFDFTIKSIKHQLVDKTYSDDGKESDDLSNPRFRYPLYCYNGYAKYADKKQELQAKPENGENFRMPVKYRDKCIKSGVMEGYEGRHFKQLNLDSPLLTVNQDDVDAYVKSIKAGTDPVVRYPDAI
jgi:hypothetical protein